MKLKLQQKFAVWLLGALLAIGSMGQAAEKPEIDASSHSTPGMTSLKPMESDVPGSRSDGWAGYTGPAAETQFPEERDRYYVPPMPLQQNFGPLKPRQITEKDFYLNIVDVSIHQWLIVKFTEEAMVRWANGAPYSKSGADLSDLFAFLARHPEVKMYRETEKISEERFDYLEANGERNTGKDLANLNNFYVLQLNPNPDPMGLILEVIALNNVETAFYAPNVQEACADIAPTTPEWTDSQNHLEAAPLGVDALYAWGYHSGGNGYSGSWCIDVEQNWTENHEDFPSSFSVLYGGDGGSTADHGDACVGLVAACNNSYGMTGISYDVDPYAISWPQQSGSDIYEQFENSFALADAILVTGESFFIEIHAQGPTPGGSCDTGCGNCGQWRYIAVEYWDNVFTAIETATANGIIVYEAGGNGQMNLDNAIYGNRFQRWFRDSGAILVGATNPTTHIAMCWSSYGSRLDCNGWGQSVWTLGYGDLWNQTGVDQDYTDTFSGTSSATPIVTGAGNDLQGVSQSKYSVTLNSSQIRDILSVTGTPWEGTRDVGERPNLVDAINRIEPDLYPAIPSGWSYSFTPRETNGATPANCLITANLDGNANTTYLNYAAYNNALYGAGAPGSDEGDVYTRLYLDDVWIWWTGTTSMGPDSWHYWQNGGPVTVRGGRHMTHWDIDPLSAIAERTETNNDIYRQFSWSPLVLTNGSGLSRSVPPLKDWGSPTYLSGDGFRATGTFWTAVGVLPQSGQDVDLYQYANVYSSTTGYQGTEDISSYGSNSCDFIVTNGNTLGFGQTRMYQAIRFDDADTSPFAVEADGSTTIANGYTTTKTLDLYDVLDVFEFNPGAGTPFFFGIDNITGGLDLAIALFQPGGDYHDRGESWIEENGGGAGQPEGIYDAPPAGGWIGAVVFKVSGSNGYAQNGTYRIRYNAGAGLLPNITTEPRTGWDDEVVLRNSADASFSDAAFPAQLQGNTTNYLNRTWYNDGPGVAATAFEIDVRIDGLLESAVLNGGVLYPLEWAGQINTNIGNITGGRHTVTMILDVVNDQSETNESDNDLYSRQLVWSPLALTRDAGVIRNAPNDRGLGFYPNSDGFSYQTGAPDVGSAVAILTTANTSDHDVTYYDDYLGTFSGFSASFGSSSFSGSSPDYLYIGFQATASHRPYYPAVYEFNNGTATYAIEADEGIAARIFYTDEWGIANPDTLPVNNIINIYEVFMTGGVQHTIRCDVIGGTGADIGMRLFNDNNTVTARGSALAAANAAGGGGDEMLTYTPAATGYYGIVVEKVNNAALSLSSIYDLTGGLNNPNDIDSLVIMPWTAGARRLDWNHVTNLDGSPVPGRRYVIYRSTNLATIPQPADSIGGTIGNSFIDSSALPGLLYYYNVKCKGN